MKVLLITFSGTGNTTLCGDFIKQAFEQEGYTVKHIINQINGEFKENLDDFDLIGFGYPIHAFNVPEAFNKFIKGLPNVKEKKYFIYKVSGEPFHLNDSSSYHIYKKLKKKGFILYSEKHFLMPYNIIFRYRNEIAKQMYLYLKPLTYLFVLEMLQNKPELIKYKFRHKVVSFFLRIEWFAPKLNTPFIHVKKKKCVSCNTCLKGCPTHAIYLNDNGKLKFRASKCAMCMRCAMYCPSNAITYGFMNPWKVNRPYLYKDIVANQNISPEYINHETKGYFKKFNKYFDKQIKLLEEYGIENPVKNMIKNG